jgi:hypothetical protein
MSGRERRTKRKVVLLVAGMMLARPTMAQDGQVDEARRSYEHGAQAPHPVTLEYANRAAMRAENAVLVMQLVQRAESRPLVDSPARVAKLDFGRALQGEMPVRHVPEVVSRLPPVAPVF